MTQTNFRTALVRFSIICIPLLSGCSFIERNTIGLFSSEPKHRTRPLPPEPEAEVTRTSPVEVEKLDQPAQSTPVEIVWPIPEEPVDGFIILYGANPDTLTEKQLSSNEIEKIESGKLGFVYRYVLPDIPVKEKLFVRIVAYRGDQRSAPSEIYEVGPEAAKP